MFVTQPTGRKVRRVGLSLALLAMLIQLADPAIAGWLTIGLTAGDSLVWKLSGGTLSIRFQGFLTTRI